MLPTVEDVEILLERVRDEIARLREESERRGTQKIQLVKPLVATASDEDLPHLMRQMQEGLALCSPSLAAIEAEAIRRVEPTLKPEVRGLLRARTESYLDGRSRP
jgi:hypothetical protein